MSHIAERSQLLQRTYGYYASLTRCRRRKAAQAAEAEPANAELDDAASHNPEPARTAPISRTALRVPCLALGYAPAASAAT